MLKFIISPIVDFILIYIILPILAIICGFFIFIFGLIYALWDFPFTWYVFTVYAPGKIDSKNVYHKTKLDKAFYYFAYIIPERNYEGNEVTTTQIIKYKQYKLDKNAKSI